MNKIDIKYNMNDEVCITGRINAIHIDQELLLDKTGHPDRYDTDVFYDLQLENGHTIRMREKHIHGTVEDIDLSIIPDEKIIDYLKKKKVITGYDI